MLMEQRLCCQELLHDEKKEGNTMATYRYQAVCQWCGATGASTIRNVDTPPSTAPSVPGKCKSHPSGKPNMPHGPKWEKR